MDKAWIRELEPLLSGNQKTLALLAEIMACADDRTDDLLERIDSFLDGIKVGISVKPKEPAA